MQTKQKDQTVDAIESLGFNYDFSETEANEKGSKTDYFRSPDCRYMLIYVQKPKSEFSPNLIVVDAKLGTLSHDPTVTERTNTLLQCRVNGTSEITKVLEFFGVAAKQ